ncbi:hypothetical protein Lal_00020093 [Lupinus albus]|uniref:Uncharacterized protein n=1 Tax=Lupinus albus TaxID=3870 RepID=A0A6A4Q6A5_LUPAL|nr:hypothetical protein Lalb_Chr08g0245861 [Lupinus albus]KAF1871301.1 hypothetical protein Lal_00020093 [Lupinus albus]
MKELSVAIADEASSIQGAETGQQEIQPQLPRKRGRPRKIVVVERNQEKKIEEAAAEGTESSTKKEEQQEESAAACISINTKKEEIQLIPKGEPSRSRARRKSKPRKST